MTTDEGERGEPGGRPDPDPAVAAATDQLFGALADPCRRFSLYYLRDAEQATLEELATVIAGWFGARADQTAVVTPERRRTVAVALHHIHLPELADCGLVTYDRETGDVELESLPERVEATLERSFALERDRPPSDDAVEQRWTER